MKALLQRKLQTNGARPLLPAGAQKDQPPGRTSATAHTTIVHDVIHSAGQPLDPAVRAKMEPRFQQDFSRVRLHTDSRADQSARAVSAAAYTVGDHIVFRAGTYSPQTPTGQKLIAHELVHTLQQRGAGRTVGQPLEIDDRNGSLEKQAERAERHSTSPSGLSAIHSGIIFDAITPRRPLIQRQPSSMEDPARYNQTHDALFTPPSSKTVAATPGSPAPVFDATAQALIKGQFTQWITDLQKNKPRVFAPDLPNNTTKANADKSTVDMDQQLRARFPQIAKPLPQTALLPHISILTETDVSADDFLRQWLAERLTVTDMATFQLGEKDPVFQKFLGDILADKTLGPLIRELARHKGAFIVEQNGTRDVKLNQGLDATQREVSLLHELVHFYADPTYKRWVDSTSNPRFFGESFTEFLARKAMTADQLTANKNAYHDRVDRIEKEIASRVPEDDIARAYFAGEVWRIEGKSAIARENFKDETGQDSTAPRATEKKQSDAAPGLVETVATGSHYRFINFGIEDAAPKSEHTAFLAEIVKSFIANDPTARLRFVGHASSPGTAAFNDKLSRERTKAFYQLARDAGAPEAQLIDAALLPHSGESSPTAGNDDVIGRAFNRRVELFITHSSSAGGATPQGLGATTTEGNQPDPVLQRKATDASPRASGRAEAPPIVHDVLHSSGQPLDAATRSFMEPRFGHDFSRIRIHTDQRAASSANAVNAAAYTVGGDLVFGPGQFSPGTEAGRRLLAHELTHALQQRSQRQATNPSGRLPIEAPDSGPEVEAERVARSVTSPSTHPRRSLVNLTGSGLALARNLAPNATAEVDTPLKETLVTGKKKTANYEWHAKYSVYRYDHDIVVEVRIKLRGKVSEKIKREWLAGINHKWNDKYRFANSQRQVSLSFRAVFTDVNPHAVVDVVNKPKTKGDWNRSTWDAGDGEGDTQGDAASHEFGHMIGNKDEYNLPDGKGGKKTLAGVMSDAHAEAKERHFTQFRDWLNAHRTKGEGEFKLEKIK